MSEDIYLVRILNFRDVLCYTTLHDIHGNLYIIITGAGVTGHIMLVVLFLIVTSSFEFIR